MLATGGIPKPLELPGADLPQVFVLRSKDHAQQILDSAKPGQRAVIIGDSFIAMESASSLRQYGLDVTVLARHAVPFAKQFGDSVGKAIRPCMRPTAWCSNGGRSRADRRHNASRSRAPG